MDNYKIPDYSDYIFSTVTTNAWALMNLMLVIVGVFLAILALADHISENRRVKKAVNQGKSLPKLNNSNTVEKEKHIWQNKLDWLIIAVILGIASVLVFALTQNLKNIMVLMNWMTIAHIIIFTVEIIALRFAYFGKKV